VGDPVTLAEELQRLVDERLRFIAAHRERLIDAWVASTGVHPEAAELVEQHEPDGTVVIRVRRRASV